MLTLKLVVNHRASADGDLSLGYLDERPAVGDANGRWYLVDSDAIIHNSGERLVWIVKHEHGIWECIHDMHWQDQYVDPKSRWVTGTPDYVETSGDGP